MLEKYFKNVLVRVVVVEFKTVFVVWEERHSQIITTCALIFAGYWNLMDTTRVMSEASFVWVKTHSVWKVRRRVLIHQNRSVIVGCLQIFINDAFFSQPVHYRYKNKLANRNQKVQSNFHNDVGTTILGLVVSNSGSNTSQKCKQIRTCMPSYSFDIYLGHSTELRILNRLKYLVKGDSKKNTAE